MTMKGLPKQERACVVFAGPLEEPSLLLEMPDPLCFWRGINAGLADRWSTGSRPSLFILLRGRLHLVELVLLLLLRRVRLEVHCEANHCAARLQLHRLRRMEFA